MKYCRGSYHSHSVNLCPEVQVGWLACAQNGILKHDQSVSKLLKFSDVDDGRYPAFASGVHEGVPRLMLGKLFIRAVDHSQKPLEKSHPVLVLLHKT